MMFVLCVSTYNHTIRLTVGIEGRFGDCLSVARTLNVECAYKTM